MKTIAAFIQRHPVLTYFALAFVISWAGILLVVGLAESRPTGCPPICK
jgi:predicted tellurium resistance membrane protein TerC